MGKYVYLLIPTLNGHRQLYTYAVTPFLAGADFRRRRHRPARRCAAAQRIQRPAGQLPPMPATMHCSRARPGARLNALMTSFAFD